MVGVVMSRIAMCPAYRPDEAHWRLDAAHREKKQMTFLHAAGHTEIKPTTARPMSKPTSPAPVQALLQALPGRTKRLPPLRVGVVWVWVWVWVAL